METGSTGPSNQMRICAGDSPSVAPARGSERLTKACAHAALGSSASTGASAHTRVTPARAFREDALTWADREAK